MLLNTIHALLTALTDALLMNIPNPAPDQPPGTGAIATVISWAKWIGYTLAGLGVIFIAVRMTIQHRRGEGGEHLGSLGWVVGAVILIGGGIGLISTLAGF